MLLLGLNGFKKRPRKMRIERVAVQGSLALREAGFKKRPRKMRIERHGYLRDARAGGPFQEASS